MKTIELTSNKEIDELKDCDALTIEGLSESAFPNLVDWVRNLTNFKGEPTLRVIRGSLMNDYCGLKGVNAYQDNLHIVCVSFNDIESYEKLIIPRFSIGGRWLSDVIGNNIRKGHKA